jgi:SAM-dependent methyltransferase
MKYCLSCRSSFTGNDWVCPNCHFSVQAVQGHLAFAPEMAAATTGFQPRYFRELADTEAKNFWFRARNQLIIWALRRYFPDAKNFLEIGCGTGFVLSGLAKAMPSVRLSGSEIFSEGLGFAAGRLSGVELFQMDARHIPFQGEFDVIGAFDVLEHIEEDEEVLAQMHQATVRKGGIVVTVPQHMFLWSQQDAHACHVRRYAAADLRKKVERAGFVVERTTSFVSLLLPLMYLARRRRRKPTDEFDPMSELRIRSFANGVLEKVLGIERLLIRLGGSFPMGGSLLLIARKR